MIDSRVTREGLSFFRKVICFDPFGQGVLSNILNILGSTSLVLLRSVNRSTGFRNLDDLRKSVSPSGDEGGMSPSGEEETPSVDDGVRPPSGREEGRLVVRGERKDEVGPSGGR